MSKEHQDKAHTPKTPPAPEPAEAQAPEVTAAPQPLETPEATVTVSKSEWDKVSGEAAEMRDKMLRMQADFDNFRKRLQREKDDSVRFANEALLETLLPVIDNFELGMQAAETSTDTKSIVMGLQMVKTQIQRFLADLGVEEINAQGQLFDPNLHDAVAQEETADAPEGTVLSQRRKGYKLRDRLLRPAVVVVAHAPAAASK